MMAEGSMSMVMLLNLVAMRDENEEEIVWDRRLKNGIGLGKDRHEEMESIDGIGTIDPKNTCGSFVGGRP
jgi:hypothetical protein